MVALLLIEVEYIVLTLATKKATWMRLLLTEIELLNKDSQYIIIKVAKSPEIKQIKANAIK